TSDRTTSAHRPPTTIAAADAYIHGRARRCTISQDSSSAMLRSVLIPANPLRASLPSAVRLPTKPMTTPATTSTTPATAKPPLLTLACGAMISALSNGGSVEPAACASAARVGALARIGLVTLAGPAFACSLRHVPIHPREAFGGKGHALRRTAETRPAARPERR